MSANNFIQINRNNFSVTARDADTNSVIEKVGKGNNLGSAIDLAEKYYQDNIVEYGICF